MNAAGPLLAVLVIATAYAIVGPILLVIALRVAIVVGGAFGLDDALGVFVASARRSFDMHRRSLDRERGEGPTPR